MARFTGERVEAAEVEDDPAVGPAHSVQPSACSARLARLAIAGGGRQLGQEEKRRKCASPWREERKTGGGERGLQLRAEGGRGKLWARLSPKEEGGVTFSFSF